MWDQKTLTAIVAAALLGSGVSLTAVGTRPELRAGAFTDKMASQLEQRVLSKIEFENAKVLHSIERHLLTGHRKNNINDEI